MTVGKQPSASVNIALAAVTSLLFWLVFTSGVAFVWPVDRIGFDPFVAPPRLLWSLIVVTMLCLGMLVRPDELRPLRKRPWWVVLGVATQVIVMPAAAWLVTRVIPMSDEIAAGVILVGCVPGAMASNVLTNTAGGSVAFSVSLTTVATLLSPITVPLVLSLVAGAHADHPLTWTSLRLALFVVLPTITGYVLSRRSELVRGLSLRFSSLVASFALLWSRVLPWVWPLRCRIAFIGHCRWESACRTRDWGRRWRPRCTGPIRRPRYRQPRTLLAAC